MCVEIFDDFPGASCAQVFTEDCAHYFGFAVVYFQRVFSFSATAIAIGGGSCTVAALLYGVELAAFYFHAV